LTVFTVTSLDDSAAVGTLRRAVFNANLAADPDVIEFAAGLTGTIELSIIGDIAFGPSALAIGTPITIQGNGNDITIGRASDGPLMRLFRVMETGDLTLRAITLSGGLARGEDGLQPNSAGTTGRGGAVFNEGLLTIFGGTVTDNEARGGDGAGSGSGGQALGGAIYSSGGIVTLDNSTFSANIAQPGMGGTPSGFGGSIYSLNESISIRHSTITDNTATSGDGAYILADGATAVVDIRNSIIGEADLPSGFDLIVSFDHSGVLEVTGTGNLIRKQNDFQELSLIPGNDPDPLLGPLDDNGGPTRTHSLMPDSPAIDAGDINAIPGVGSVPLLDQRGMPYGRVKDGGIGGYRIDIGALELQLPGDYNGDRVVNSADYTAWRNAVGTQVAPFAAADGNGSTWIDMGDYHVWKQNYGQVLPMGAAAIRDVPQKHPEVTAAPAAILPQASAVQSAPADENADAASAGDASGEEIVTVAAHPEPAPLRRVEAFVPTAGGWASERPSGVAGQEGPGPTDRSRNLLRLAVAAGGVLSPAANADAVAPGDDADLLRSPAEADSDEVWEQGWWSELWADWAKGVWL
jgi:hypothetical protein